MTLLLSEDDVRVVLDMPTAIEAVEQSFPTVRVLQKPIERELLQKIFVANSADMLSPRPARWREPA